AGPRDLRRGRVQLRHPPPVAPPQAGTLPGSVGGAGAGRRFLQPGARRLAVGPRPRTVPRRAGHHRGAGRPLEQAPRRRGAAWRAAGDRLRGRGLLLEVARAGVARREEARRGATLKEAAVSASLWGRLKGGSRRWQVRLGVLLVAGL